MKSLLVIVIGLALSGCVGASTSNKVCASLDVVGAGGKKCAHFGVNGDSRTLSGGVDVGVSNE